MKRLDVIERATAQGLLDDGFVLGWAKDLKVGDIFAARKACSTDPYVMFVVDRIHNDEDRLPRDCVISMLVTDEDGIPRAMNLGPTYEVYIVQDVAV